MYVHPLLVYSSIHLPIRLSVYLKSTIKSFIKFKFKLLSLCHYDVIHLAVKTIIIVLSR